MSDWENDFDDEPIAVAEGAYKDEVDDALDDWEAEADENQREKPAVRNRRDIEQVKKEREELKRQEELKKKEALKDEDPLAKRERLEKIQLKNDLDATQDLFGVVEATKSFTVRESVKQVRSLEEILAQKPESKQDYESLAKSLAEKLTEYSTITSSKIPKKSPHWIGFLEVLYRELCDQSNIDYVDIRKLSSVLSTLSNEKQRAEKDKKGKGKSTKKAQLKVESSSAFESAAVEGGLDDGYDDFM